MSLKNKAIKGISWTLFQQLGIAFFSFFIHMKIGRLITPSDLGTYALLAVFIAVGNSISDSGMGQSIIRSNDLDDEDFGTIFLTNLGISLSLYMLIVLLSPLIANFYDNKDVVILLAVLSLSIILSSFSSIHISRLTKIMDFKSQAIIQLPSVVVSGIVGLVLAYKNFGVWSLIIMTVLKNFTLSFQYWFFSGWRPKFVFSKEKFKKHFDFGYKLTLSGLISTVLSNVVDVIIGTYYSKAQLGFFTQASTMRDYPITMITSALNKVTYPIFAEVKENKELLLSAYKKIQNIVLFVTGPMMLIAILVATPLFSLVLGDKWLDSVFYFQFFAITGVFHPMHVYNLNILKVVGKSDVYLLVSVLKKISLIFFVLITCTQGLTMLMLGLVAHNFVALFINIYFGAKELGYTMLEQIKDFLIILLPALLSFGIVYASNRYFNYSSLMSNFTEIIAVTLVYSLIYLVISILLKGRAIKDFVYTLSDIKFLTPYLSKVKKII